jgi:hypothetical protein
MVYGLSTTIRTGSENVMEQGSVVQEVSGLHVVVGRSNPRGGVSVSTQVAVLRRLLLGWEKGDTQTVGYFLFFSRVGLLMKVSREFGSKKRVRWVLWLWVIAQCS